MNKPLARQFLFDLVADSVANRELKLIRANCPESINLFFGRMFSRELYFSCESPQFALANRGLSKFGASCDNLKFPVKIVVSMISQKEGYTP